MHANKIKLTYLGLCNKRNVIRHKIQAETMELLIALACCFPLHMLVCCGCVVFPAVAF